MSTLAPRIAVAMVNAIASVPIENTGLRAMRDPPEVVARQVAFGHRVLHRFALADQIEHHHRVGEQRDQRGKNPEGDVAREIARRIVRSTAVAADRSSRARLR